MKENAFGTHDVWKSTTDIQVSSTYLLSVSASGNRTLLWVDDNPDNNVKETEMLRKFFGLEVIQKTSTAEARKFLEVLFPSDAVLYDFRIMYLSFRKHICCFFIQGQLL